MRRASQVLRVLQVHRAKSACQARQAGVDRLARLEDRAGMELLEPRVQQASLDCVDFAETVERMDQEVLKAPTDAQVSSRHSPLSQLFIFYILWTRAAVLCALVS